MIQHLTGQQKYFISEFTRIAKEGKYFPEPKWLPALVVCSITIILLDVVHRQDVVRRGWEVGRFQGTSWISYSIQDVGYNLKVQCPTVYVYILRDKHSYTV